MSQQSLGKTYAQIINFGRILESRKYAKLISEDKPEIVLGFVEAIDRQLLWTEVDKFFELFPPIKRYENDGSWDYESTQKMRKEKLGTHFGKDDFKHLLMTTCYENKFLQNIGYAFIDSISEMHKRTTGRSMMMDFFESQGVKTYTIPD